MSEATKIEWADHTWSPWRGCTKVSPGCAHCYAETLSRRNPAVLGEWGPDGKRVINADWKKPLAWDRAAKRDGVRRRVFPSLCDVFEDRDDLIGPRNQFFSAIHATEKALDWLVLTKRPENIARLWPPSFWKPSPEHWPNLWLGVSVEDQHRANERIPKLLEIPAAVRWLSVEPLIGPVDLKLSPADSGDFYRDLDARCRRRALDRICGIDRVPVDSIDWVVVGGESGPNARPCDLAWIRSIVTQCHDAGVPAYVKQLGSRPFDSSIRVAIDGPDSHAVALDLRHPKGGNPAEWPKDLRVREYPKQAKGGRS